MKETPWSPSQQQLDNWSALETQERVEIVMRTAKRMQKKLLMHRNVVAVGFGYRQRKRCKSDKKSQVTIARGRVLDHSEPVVKVYVRRKWRSTFRGQQERLPKHLLAYTSSDQGRRAVAVPVDVDSFEGVELQSTELRMLSPSNATLSRGAICCLVVAQGMTFAVTCAHVTAGRFPPNFNVLGLPRAATISGWLALTSDIRYSKDPTNSNDTRGFFLDVGLIRCTPEQVNQLRATVPIFLGFHASPSGYPRTFTVRTPRGDIPAVYSGQPLTSSSPVASQNSVGIKYEQYVKSVAATLPGDSGSPVFDPQTQRLLGIHFAGDVSLSEAYMLPAWLFIQNTRYFNTPLQLT